MIQLSDGREIFSGVPGQAAVMEASLTTRVCPGESLEPGGVCAAMAELTVLSPGGPPVTAGEEFTLFHVGEDGARTKVGIFRAELPEGKTGSSLYRITAYDRIAALDRDLTGWLRDFTGWPCTLRSLAEAVCIQCGLTLLPGELPNGNFLAQPFTGSGVTGRKLLGWIAQAAGRFCRATEEGEVEFAWFAPRDLTLEPTGEQYYFAGGLSLGSYTVAPVDKVQIRATTRDVGAVYPDIPEGNTLTLTGNPLLAGTTTQVLEEVAQTLYEQFHTLTYTPATITLPADSPARAGDILTVRDKEGVAYTVYVMSRVQTGQRAVLYCTGPATRDSSRAVNQLSYQALTGRVLELSLDLEGMALENRDTAGNLAALSLDLEGIRTRVEQQDAAQSDLARQVTTLTQTGAGLELAVERLRQEGAASLRTAMGYTFDDTGLHIRNPAQEISATIDHTGLVVRRSGDPVLQATAQGVRAVDVSVENYLAVGSHARLEDYSDGADTRRTACFWRE